jgi:tetratricopeptide (TPR) repeat protein
MSINSQPRRFGKSAAVIIIFAGLVTTLTSSQVSASNAKVLATRLDTEIASAQKALESAQKTNDPEAVYKAEFHLADVQYDQQSYAAALPHYLSAISDKLNRDRLHGVKVSPTDLELARYRNKAATCMYQAQNYGEALPLYKQALAVVKRTSPDSEECANFITDVADCYYQLSSFEEAYQNYKGAYNIRRQVLPANSPDTATSVYYMAMCRQYSGDNAGAALLFQQAIDLRDKCKDEEGLAQALEDLGHLNYQDSSYPRALQLYQRATKLREKQKNLDAMTDDADHVDEISDLLARRPDLVHKPIPGAGAYHSISPEGDLHNNPLFPLLLMSVPLAAYAIILMAKIRERTRLT